MPMLPWLVSVLVITFWNNLCRFIFFWFWDGVRVILHMIRVVHVSRTRTILHIAFCITIWDFDYLISDLPVHRVQVENKDCSLSKTNHGEMRNRWGERRLLKTGIERGGVE